MVGNSVLIILGFLFLIKGAAWLVDGAAGIARSFKISDLVIGLTIVSLGTSAPELLVNVMASWRGSSDIALGNVVGSNIANLLLILGCASIVMPLSITPATFFKEIPFSLLSAGVLCVLVNDKFFNGEGINQLSRSEGLILLSFLMVFLVYLFGIASIKRAIPSGEEHHVAPLGRRKMVFLIGLGLIFLVVGGEMAVKGAINLATNLGVSERIIGLTIVAIGTSLPELLTSMVAAKKGNSDISIGNVVGSNIFNIFWILGVSALVAPLPLDPSLNFDILVMIGATALLLLLIQRGTLWNRIRFWRVQEGYVLERWEGGVLLAVYLLYLASLIHGEIG